MWREITENLKHNQIAQDRPDLSARVFLLKLVCVKIFFITEKKE